MKYLPEAKQLSKGINSELALEMLKKAFLSLLSKVWYNNGALIYVGIRKKSFRIVFPSMFLS